MAFVKGVSGNPSGRPPITLEQRQFTAWCQEAAIKLVKNKLEKFLANNNPIQEQWACDVILERAFGRPMQVNQNENYDMNEAKPLTDAELKAKAMEFLSADTRNDSQGTGIPPVQ